MPSALPHPKVHRTTQATQLSFETSHRIHTVKSYPIPSPNGSNILLYGHDHGVRIIWRGGRPFKPQKATNSKEKTNGAKDDSVMIIDSDDEQTPAEVPFEDNPEFEDEEEELDPLNPYVPVIQYLDLVFGVDVLHIAVPPLPVSLSKDPSKRGPQILQEHILFTVACADHSVRVVSLPLQPPSPESKARPIFRKDFTAGNAGNGKWGESVLVLSGHQALPNSVTMTLIPHREEPSTTRTRSRSRSQINDVEWDLLVASHSPEITGLILLYRTAISDTLPTEYLEPFQTQYLSTPATSIAFNPGMATSPRSTHLLITDNTAIRIYSPPKPSSPPSSPTIATIPQGRFLLALHSPFTTGSLPTRKAIVSASWIAAGQALIVLLADGEWGVWDIEGVSPSAPKGLLGRQGIKGGSSTPFSIGGWIEGAPVKTSKMERVNANSRFAPMTPATRRTVEPTLFQRHTAGNGANRGGVVVSRKVGAGVGNITESVGFWLEDSFAIVPDFANYWEALVRKTGSGGTLFGKNTRGGRMVRIEAVDLKGEKCTGIELMAREEGPLGVDLLLGAEHRFVMCVRENGPRVPFEKQVAVLDGEGDLDVMDIDEALMKMDDGNGNGNGNGQKRGRLF